MEELVWRNMLQFHAGLLGIIVVCLVLFLPGGLRGAGWVRTLWRQRTAEARP
jgi:branched-chain amino acid transport system permease protein